MWGEDRPTIRPYRHCCRHPRHYSPPSLRCHRVAAHCRAAERCPPAVPPEGGVEMEGRIGEKGGREAVAERLA